MAGKSHPLEKFHYCPVCGSGRFVVNNFKSKRCLHCGFVYYFNPSAAVACFVRDRTGRVLVAVRANEPAAGSWDLPGGFVDMDETGEEAVRRELKEETGLDIGDVRYLFSEPNTYPYSGFDVQTLDMFFECSVENFADMVPADDVSGLLAVDRDDIDCNKFGLESVRRAVVRYIK